MSRQFLIPINNKRLLSFFKTSLCCAFLFDVYTLEDYLSACDTEAYLLIEAHSDVKCKEIRSLSESVEELRQPFEELPCIAPPSCSLVGCHLSDKDSASDIEYRRSRCGVAVCENTAYAVAAAVRGIGVWNTSECFIL